LGDLEHELVHNSAQTHPEQKSVLQSFVATYRLNFSGTF
jgi:hypothetical protein